MEKLLKNPGFCHLAVKILQNVDFDTLTRCRLVSTVWMDFIDVFLFWWRQKLRKSKLNVKFLKTHPKWKKVFFHMETKSNLAEIKAFVASLQKFMEETKNSPYQTLFSHATASQNWEFIQFLLAIPHDFEEKLSDSNAILHIIAQAGKLTLLKTVIDVGILDFNVKDDYGNTPLHVACSHGHYEIVKTLLIYAKYLGIDVNATSDDGWTPLHEAVYFEHHQIVNLMLHYSKMLHLKPHLSDNDGKTPLKIAIENNSLEIVKLFQTFTE